MVGQDVSKQTIVVLVFLAILVTLLGTLTVMSEFSKVRGASSDSQTLVKQNTGYVSLTIKESKPVTGMGQVYLNIASSVDTWEFVIKFYLF